MIGKGHIRIEFERAMKQANDIARIDQIEIILGQLESETLNEGVSSDLIAKINKLIEQVTDSVVIQDILIRLYKSTFDQRLSDIQLTKDIPPKDAEDFKRKFYSVQGSYEEKKQFLDILEEGVFDFKSIDNNKVLKISTLLSKVNPFILSMTQEISEWSPKLGASSATGSGEAFLIYFVKGGKKASSGDFALGGSKYEIKGTKMSNGSSGGRVKGMGKYEPSVKNAFDFFMNELQKIHGKKLKLPKDPNFYNFKTGTPDQLNSVMPKTKSKTKALLSKVFMNIYDLNDFKWLDSVITDDGKLVDGFYKELAYYQANSYISHEGFKKYIFINTANQTLLVTSIKQMKKHIENGTIKVGGSCSFKDATSSTYQFGLAQ